MSATTPAVASIALPIQAELSVSFLNGFLHRQTQYRIRAESGERALVTDHAIIAFARVALDTTTIIRDGMGIAGQMPARTQLRLIAMWQFMREAIDVAVGVVYLCGRDGVFHGQCLSISGRADE